MGALLAPQPLRGTRCLRVSTRTYLLQFFEFRQQQVQSALKVVWLNELMRGALLETGTQAELWCRYFDLNNVQGASGRVAGPLGAVPRTSGSCATRTTVWSSTACTC